MDMRKIAVIGTGGINSWSAKYLAEIIELFSSKEVAYIKLFDADVVEEKNLLRSNQNFEVADLLMNKAEVLAKKYGFDFAPVYIDESNIAVLEGYDEVILGVDNHKTRKLVYDYCLKNNIYCLDLRAQGTILSYVVVDGTRTMDYYNQKYFSNPEVMERKGGCQLESDVKNDHIENANKAIAYLGMYCIFLKRMRKEKPSTDEWKFVY